MATVMNQLPCDADGVCMICKNKPSETESVVCTTCATPWHIDCLSIPPQTLADALKWNCPDCSMDYDPNLQPVAGVSAISGDLMTAIREIEADLSITENEKARRRQELLSGGSRTSETEKVNVDSSKSVNDILNLIDERLNCSFCMQLPERPVTTPCGHNFCLKCFQKWISQGKNTCANCRKEIPQKMAKQPRINSALVFAIRMAKMSKSENTVGPPKVYHFLRNQDRPDKAFTTDRAKKSGKANACSGKIFVTTPPDHFGPILAANDPLRGQGVLVGESWEDRLECRQWGTHLPMVGGIAGQAKVGAQSVALSGGYTYDQDNGEWFLYTGSGGRDLSGNKRTNKNQTSDQIFSMYNESLRASCREGYPVRVVRSHKEKRSSYAPESGVRYDGIYRIEKTWRIVGTEGFKVCRYLFVRCDNGPAPWTSDEHGDRPRPLPAIKELKTATDITERKGSPAWDFDEEKECWTWKKNPPQSRKRVSNVNTMKISAKRLKSERHTRNISIRDKLLKEFSCLICWKVMVLPITTPCAHNFCKSCLENAFAGQSFIKERTCLGGRTLRAQKTVMKCPCCPNDISDFLQNLQVNREVMGIIESLQEMVNSEENQPSDDDEKPETVTETVQDTDPSDPSEDQAREKSDSDRLTEDAQLVSQGEEAEDTGLKPSAEPTQPQTQEEGHKDTEMKPRKKDKKYTFK